MNPKTDTLILRGRKGEERVIKPGKWWINRHTPVGEDADIFERKPHDGARWVNPKEIIRCESIST